MSGDFSEKLNAVLSNPVLMAQLREMADSMKETPASPEEAGRGTEAYGGAETENGEKAERGTETGRGGKAEKEAEAGRGGKAEREAGTKSGGKAGNGTEEEEKAEIKGGANEQNLSGRGQNPGAGNAPGAERERKSGYLKEKPDNPALLSPNVSDDPVFALARALGTFTGEQGKTVTPASLLHSKALLLAVKPYLDKERQEKADKMIRMLALAEIADRWI